MGRSCFAWAAGTYASSGRLGTRRAISVYTTAVTSSSSRTIMPAHGRPFHDAPRRAAALVSHHHRRLDQITEIVAAGERSAWQVALELWGERDNLYEKRLALQEALAHLQALAVEGRLEKLVSPSAVRWRPPSSSV